MTARIKDWIDDYKITNANAISIDWFVSPLEYFWPDGKKAFDTIFPVSTTRSKILDKQIAPELYIKSMNNHFRAQMIVLGFMKQNIAKTYGLEIENGLMHLYKLDYLSTISQWTYVIEGYSRKLFKVKSNQSSKHRDWTTPTVSDKYLNDLIICLVDCLGQFLDKVLFVSTNDRNLETINRHLLLHGNADNNEIYNQKNSLLLMFCLDSLLVIEMIESGVFPAMLETNQVDDDRIKNRELLYGQIHNSTYSNENLLKIKILKEHV